MNYYTIEDLIKNYAECEEISHEEANEQYEAGMISKYSLLEAYLHNEGIFGYTPILWSIFEALTDTDA